MKTSIHLLFRASQNRSTNQSTLVLSQTRRCPSAATCWASRWDREPPTTPDCRTDCKNKWSYSATTTSSSRLSRFTMTWFLRTKTLKDNYLVRWKQQTILRIDLRSKFIWEMICPENQLNQSKTIQNLPMAYLQTLVTEESNWSKKTHAKLIRKCCSSTASNRTWNSKSKVRKWRYWKKRCPTSAWSKNQQGTNCKLKLKANS